MAFGACLAGMATKEVMVTAPLLVFLFDRTFLAGSFTGAWRARRGPLLALAATWLLLAFLVAGGGGSRGVAAGFGHGVSSWHYLLTQSEALVRYLSLSLWPHPLVLDYGRSLVRSPLEVWWQGGLVLALLGGTLWALCRRPLVGFLGAWFFLWLAPSSSFVPLVTQTIAEHRMYLALVPIVLGFVLAAGRLGDPLSRWLLGGAAVALLAGTVLRNHDYRDAITVWQTSVAAFPASARAHNNLAQALQEAGRPAEAERAFTRAVATDPDYASARYTWGVALLAAGRLADAVTQLQAAVRLAPGHADAHLNLGTALTRLQRPAEAIPHFEAALRLAPAADAHYNLSVAFLDLDRLEDATRHLRQALELQPGLPEAHYQLGRIAERAGNPAAAAPHYLAALRLAPEHLGAHRRLGLLLARQGDLDGAAGHFRALVRLQPADADAHANLGNTLLLQGRVREAIAAYEEALRLRPEDPRARENLRLAREALR
jgi:tetratricopeptide (TPR) repeat protein